MDGNDSNGVTVRTLRRLWKPHKERLAAVGKEQPAAVRFHRACSWMARVEGIAATEDPDLALICLWIAFNALYGQWNSAKCEPHPDRQSWQKFIDRLLKLDRQGRIPAMLEEHKRLVLALFDDEYVSSFFWQEPSAERGKKARNAKLRAHSWYAERAWTMILEEAIGRVYVMRCQLVHGAATYGGKLNRRSLAHCVMMMQRLLPTLLLVWIDHGADEDWGPMCYPPLTAKR